MIRNNNNTNNDNNNTKTNKELKTFSWLLVHELTVVCPSLTLANPVALFTASVVSCGGRQSASCFKSNSALEEPNCKLAQRRTPPEAK